MRVPEDEDDPEAFCQSLSLTEDWENDDGLKCTKEEREDAAAECIMKGKEAYDDFCAALRTVSSIY